MRNLNLNNVDKLKAAIDNNEFYKYLIGEAAYKIELSEFVPVNLPTDFDSMLDSIYTFYQENNKVQLLLEENVSQLLAGTEEDVYFAMYIIFNMIRKEYRGIASFVSSDKLLPLLKQKLKLQESNLKALKKWRGIDKEDGVWSDVLNRNNQMKENFQLYFIDDKE